MTAPALLSLLSLSPSKAGTADERGIVPLAEEGDPAKRRQIVAGARAVFLEKGFEGASMGEIARSAGVSKGTLYVYFQNKEQLFCAIMEEERRTHHQILWSIDVTLPVGDALRQFGRNLLGFLLRPEKIAAMRTAVGIAERMPEVGRIFYERGPAMTMQVVADYLQAKVAAGDLEIADPAIAAAQLLDLLQSSLVRPALFGIEPAESERDAKIARVVDAGVDMFMRAYGTPPRG